MSMSAQSAEMQVTTPAEREIRTERVFEAPLAKVWRAFTEPELLKQWWGRGNELVIERYELERGGHWRFVEHAEGEKHGFEGRFREIEPRSRISMTFEWDGMPGHVIVDTSEFEELADGRTRVVTTSLFFTQEDRDGMLSSGMAEGLSQSYVALDRVLAAMK